MNQPGLDIFGNKPDANGSELCECFHCRRKFQCQRYAHHLEKCLGLGRTSTRTQRRFVASAEDFLKYTLNDRTAGPSPYVQDDGQDGEESEHQTAGEEDDEYVLTADRNKRVASRGSAIGTQRLLTKKLHTQINSDRV